MTKDEAYKILVDTVANDIKHPDYKHVTDLAKDYKTYITGKGIDAKLKRFNPREDQDMFDQRVKLTIATTPAVASSIKRPFNKVPRTPPVTKKVAAKDKNDEKAVAEIQERINTFYGGDANVGGLDYWIQNRFVDLSFIDPNSWIIIEFDPFDPNTTKASPRPFEVSSEQAIRFSILNNKVQWLIIETDIDIPLKQPGLIKAQSPLQTKPSTIVPDLAIVQHKKGKKYTIYADNDAITLTQTSDQDKDRMMDVPGEQLIQIEGKGTFIVNFYDTKTEQCPAFRVGYIPDIETKGRTYVNPFHDALCHFEKSIKIISEFDLSTCLHTFPQKIVRITKTCEGTGGQRCNKGRLVDGTTCSNCRGTGKPIHTTGQDIIEVSMPDTKEEYVPLSDFVHYVDTPVELLKFQMELADSLEVKCHQTVFNSTALLRKKNGGQQIDPTATEINNDMESVYDTLSPFGEKVSSVWTFVVQFIAILTDNSKKVNILHRFPSNYKLKTRTDLYTERKLLNEAGSPPFVLDAVDDELAQDIYADDADSLLQYRVKKDHFPFKGKSPEDIQFLLSASTTLKKTKVLYTYFDQIFIELQREYIAEGKDFYLEKATDRKKAIDEKVQEIIQELNEENQTAFTIPGIPLEKEEEVKTEE